MKMNLLKVITLTGLQAISLNLLAYDSYQSSKCNGMTLSGNEIDCRSEVVISGETRTLPYLAQPVVEEKVMGQCGQLIPNSQSFRYSAGGVTCGEGAEKKTRTETKYSEENEATWQEWKASGAVNALEKMQAVKTIELKWTGAIDFPMSEQWSWQYKEHGFADRCGDEDYTATCQRERYESWQETVEDRSNCLKYEQVWVEDPKPVERSNSDFGGSSSGSSGSSYTPSFENNDRSKAEKGAGESRSEKYERNRSRADSVPDDSANDEKRIEQARRIASGHYENGSCLKYGTKVVTRTREIEPYTYSCTKKRNKYCTWFATRSQSRACPSHTLKYLAEYKHDPKWQPGYQDPTGNKVRDYSELLPNRFDLLSKEYENIYVWANTGSSSSLNPAFTYESRFNQYHAEVQPSTFKCEYGMQPKARINIITDGRIMAKSPNALSIPIDPATGKQLSPLAIEPGKANGKPYALVMQDTQRAMMLAASEISHTYARPANAPEKSSNGLYKASLLGEVDNSVSPTKGFWVDTQFRMQLFRVHRAGLIRYGHVVVLNGNQADMFGDRFEMDLTGKNGYSSTYAGSGPLEDYLGFIWKHYPVELTPGETYLYKIQSVQRGLPFYESGCKGSASDCEGQEASKDSFSEPLEIRYTVPEDAEDHRSWLDWLEDLQLKTKIK